jgi:CBS domain-containing protein
MTKDVISVTPSTPLADVARMFSEDRISGAPVIDSTERLVGIVSRTDVITGLLAGADGTTPEMRSLLGIGETEEDEPEDGGDVPDPEATSGPVVEDVMDGDPATVAPETPIPQVARRMARERLHRVLVTEDGRVAGILTSIDVLGHFPAPAAAARPATPRPPKARASASAKGKTAARKPAARAARRR